MEFRGLRRVFGRRPPDDTQNPAPKSDETGAKSTRRPPRHSRHSLVVGSAELRRPPVDLPEFYAGSDAHGGRTNGSSPASAGASRPPAAKPSPFEASASAPSAVVPPIGAAAAVSPPRPAPRPTPAPAPAPTAPQPTPAATTAPRSPAELFGENAPRNFDPEMLRQAWDLVSDRVDQLIRNFYAELFFALGGEAFQMFPPGMSDQRDEFGRVLVQWVVSGDPKSMSAHLDQLGADHRKFGVQPRHYETAGKALLSAWSVLAGPRWTPEMERAVVGSYVRLASVMLDGALRHEGHPAAWGATVVEHERVHRDFAVLRIQPDAPYLYRAGQYMTLELAARPKMWRQMSIASAPRPDNTFDIHVRNVSSTGVSGSLVMHTSVGDRLQLGPPRGGDLVVEPGTVPSGVLCIGSGTGAAPINAVVESMLRWSPCPPIEAYLGGRTANDMYVTELLNSRVLHGGLGERVQVHGVVSDDAGYPGLHGRVEDVVADMRDWATLGVDVLVAGPDPMIARTVLGLTDRGVPLERIHFDQYVTAA